MRAQRFWQDGHRKDFRSPARWLGMLALSLLLMLAGCSHSAATSTTRTTPTPSATPLQGKQVVVHPSDGWLNTHITVKPGNRLTLGCNGHVTDPGTAQVIGPNGTSQLASGASYPLQGVFDDSLIGRIASAKPFYVGAAFDHTLVPQTGTGTLELRVNAASSRVSGAFTCQVRVQQFSRTQLDSFFYGTATVQIYDPDSQGFGGPYTQEVSLTSTVDGSRTLIELTSFPPLTVGPISTAAGNDTITVTPVDVFGAFGPYGPTSPFDKGKVSSLPLTLRFKNSVSLAGTCIAPFAFTTGTTVSPGKHFRATGKPVDQNGDVTLVGSSRFSCNAFYNPTDGKDVVMTITGTMLPSPV